MPYYDFAEIKAAHPIDDVTQRLGLNLVKHGKSWRGKCPACESSGDRNLAVTPERGVFYCFSDGKGGDVLQLVAHVKGISVKDAAGWLQGPANPEKGTSKEKTKGGASADEPSGGFKALDYLDPNHEAVVALGLEPDDAERIGAGYAPRGVLRGTVAFPIRDTAGKLLGYIGVQDVKLPPRWAF